METNGAIPVKRGCGLRESGGVYAETGIGPGGAPLEFFLADPPLRIDKQELCVTELGVHLLEVDGVWHILNIVGQENYPNVADWLEEARRFGVSTRCELPSAREYAKITLQSRLLQAHARAWTDEFAHYYADWCPVEPGHVTYEPCPKMIYEHLGFVHNPEATEATMCAGIWWNDVEGGIPRDDPSLPFSENPRYVLREMPSFTYAAARPPEGLQHNSYQLAIFGVFPITRLVVVNDQDANRLNDQMGKASAAGVPVVLVEE